MSHPGEHEVNFYFTGLNTSTTDVRLRIFLLFPSLISVVPWMCLNILCWILSRCFRVHVTQLIFFNNVSLTGKFRHTCHTFFSLQGPAKNFPQRVFQKSKIKMSQGIPISTSYSSYPGWISVLQRQLLLKQDCTYC